MRLIAIMILSLAVLGHETTAEAFLGFGKKKESTLDQAEKSYRSREYYRARRLTQEALNQNPQDERAVKLMGNILDKEIERQKEHLLPQAIEEMDADDRQDEIKTWMERANTLFASNQYDLALFAAEKVFLYDAENQLASELIDRIKGKAIREGKAETLFIHKMYKEEIADRLQQYRQQAEEFAADGQFGQARFTAEKILLLEPEDPRALALLQRIRGQEDNLRDSLR